MNQKIRTNTAPKQNLLSLIILGILAVICGGVFIAQFNYNPAVQQMSPVLASGDSSPLPPAASADKSAISLPPGQSPLSPPETFDAATLSDKINGKAELYLSAGFVRLQSQRFTDEATGEVWMEAFVYDMQTPQNAFSVFSAQRREDALMRSISILLVLGVAAALPAAGDELDLLPIGDPQLATLLASASPGTFFDCRADRPLDLEELAAELVKARVVLLGEAAHVVLLPASCQASNTASVVECAEQVHRSCSCGRDGRTDRRAALYVAGRRS